MFRYISKQVRYSLLKYQDWKCQFCHVRLKFSEDHDFDCEVAQIDHIHPFSEADSYPNHSWNISEIENLQALCPGCNKGKRTAYHG